LLTSYIGLSGSGKTTVMIGKAFKAYERDIDVYANIKLNFPYTHYTTFDELCAITDGYVIADELWISMDSRISGSKRNRAMSYLLNQIRKNNVLLDYTAQQLHSMDKRVRDNTRFMNLPRFIQRPTRKFPNGYIENKVYELGLISGYEFVKKQRIDPTPIWELFNTYEHVTPITFGDNEKKK